MGDIKTMYAPKEGLFGYKAFNQDLTCRGFQYEIGETYKLEEYEKLELCKCGFHFCVDMDSCFNYYMEVDPETKKSTRICRVRASGEIQTDGDKYVAREIEILEEVQDVKQDHNIGAWNRGNDNIGCLNRGDRNTGNSNKGFSNTGSCNEGDKNYGYKNLGRLHIGVYNEGGNCTGLFNHGYDTVGRCNHGNHIIGCGNDANFAIGLFNTKATPIYIFNKLYEPGYEELYKNHSRALNIMLDLIKDKGNMDAAVSHLCFGGERLLEYLYRLPNFDEQIFEQLTGLDIKELRKKLTTPTIWKKKNPESDES